MQIFTEHGGRRQRCRNAMASGTFFVNRVKRKSSFYLHRFISSLHHDHLTSPVSSSPLFVIHHSHHSSTPTSKVSLSQIQKTSALAVNALTHLFSASFPPTADCKVTAVPLAFFTLNFVLCCVVCQDVLGCWEGIACSIARCPLPPNESTASRSKWSLCQ